MEEIEDIWQGQQVQVLTKGEKPAGTFVFWHRVKNAAEKTSDWFFLNEDVWKVCMERAGVCCVFSHPFLDLVLDLICFPVT